MFNLLHGNETTYRIDVCRKTSIEVTSAHVISYPILFLMLFNVLYIQKSILKWSSEKRGTFYILVWGNYRHFGWHRTRIVWRNDIPLKSEVHLYTVKGNVSNMTGSWVMVLIFQISILIIKFHFFSFLRRYSWKMEVRSENLQKINPGLVETSFPSHVAPSFINVH